MLHNLDMRLRRIVLWPIVFVTMLVLELCGIIIRSCAWAMDIEVDEPRWDQGVCQVKLRKILSGGQTGADKAGLEIAKELGLETGGTAPKGYRTESGTDHSLKELGLVESPYWQYQPRTKQNVKDADITVWFGNIGSPGYWCTRNSARACHKLFIENPTPEYFRELAESYEVINIAGNRASTNLGVFDKVKNTIREALRSK